MCGINQRRPTHLNVDNACVVGVLLRFLVVVVYVWGGCVLWSFAAAHGVRLADEACAGDLAMSYARVMLLRTCTTMSIYMYLRVYQPRVS